jgi:hypothetical protein
MCVCVCVYTYYDVINTDFALAEEEGIPALKTEKKEKAKVQRSAAPKAPSSRDESSVLLVQKSPEHSSSKIKEGNRGQLEFPKQRYSVYLLCWYISTNTDAAKRRTGTSWRPPRIRCQYLYFCTCFSSTKVQILTPEAWGIAIAGTCPKERDLPPPERDPPPETDGSASRTNRAAPGPQFTCGDDVLLIEMKLKYADLCWRMLRC